MPEVTQFESACIEMGWGKPSQFLRAFEMTAAFLGEPVTVTDRHYRRWRQPQPPNPQGRNWRVLHAMFGVDPRELGFPGPPPNATVGDAPLLPQEGTTVERRAFMQDTIGTVASVGFSSPPGRATPPGPKGAIGTAHVVELREGLRSLYQLDDAYGGGDVRSLARKHLRRIERVINAGRYPDTIGRQLQLLAGETAEHCAWLFYDADDQGRARRYWGDALTAATVLGDDSLAILVLASLSMQASHEGRPRDGLNLARAAQERALRYGSPALRSLLASREARALSLLGDTVAAKKRLVESLRLVDRGVHDRPSPDWAAFHGHAELDYAQGLLHTEAGHHAAASQFLRAALTHQDRTYGRNRALYRLTLARSLVQSGEVDEGAAHAVGSLEHLEEVESGRVTRRLTEVTGLLRSTDAVSAHEAANRLTEYTQKRGAA
ncbi:hypothetical protein [Streptomyces sp. NPDC045251]|uniref:hypothetical protein n=1 Tax=unclassified Streptomyces TaxID=2593676 RepID=UPI0034084A35